MKAFTKFKTDGKITQIVSPTLLSKINHAVLMVII